MPLQSSGSGQRERRRHRHHHHHPHQHQGGASTTSATTRTTNNNSSELEVTLADPTNGHGGAAAAVSGNSSSAASEAMERFLSTNGVEMNGFGRRGKSQSPAEVTSLVPITTSLRNGSAANGQAWRLTKVFNENDEALINRKLPKELLLRIFSHLDVVSLCRCAQVI